MTLILRQSTSIDIRMGPFVDNTDAVTPETGVTLAGADQAEVLKANGAATSAMAGTFAAVTGADGWYDYTVAAGDVDTVGEVVFVVQDADVCLPVFVRGQVVEEAVYDAMYAASATGPAQAGDAMDLITDAVDATSVATGAIDADAIAADAITSAKIAAGAIAKGDQLTGLNDLSSAQVNTEVVDALFTDTISELSQGAPAATPTIATALMLLYMMVRNKLDVTSSVLEVHNDAGTVICKKALTDDGSTYSEAEMVTGP